MGIGRDYDAIAWAERGLRTLSSASKVSMQSGSGNYRWRTREGNIVNMNDMDIQHLRNAYNMCVRTGNTGKGDQLKEILEKKEGKKMKYEVGDIVRKRFGQRPIEITYVSGTRCSGKYIHSGAAVSYVYDYELVKYDGEIENEKGNGNMNGKLYQVKNTGAFGIGLAVNSAGEYVLEMKGDGAIQTFAKDAIEVVMPYTFAIKWNGGNDQHYVGKAGVLEVGDLVLEITSKNLRVGVVSKVNTKREGTKAQFKGVKLVTVALDVDDGVVEDY